MQTWLITGVSTGFGRALAQEVLARGDRVVGTLRQAAQREAFEALAPGRASSVLLDVTHADEVTRVIAAVEQRIGAIDVLVNNAGYGHEAVIEEASMADIRAQFEVNFFGAVAVLKAVLPHMRARRSGRIINITSMGGLMTFPALGVYHASKFALEALNATLSKEVQAFGVKVTAVEPGGFRTDWAGRSLQRSEARLPEYEALFGAMRQARAARSGKQTGDPARAAQAIYRLAHEPNPPVHLLLGSDALSYVRSALEDHLQEIERWAHVTTSTDFQE
jgi:NAD(P)-dependent dehydrogenase (short-subunit alcohol dehydrogenase family)